MADTNDKPRPFDVGTIRYLVRLMQAYDLSEIDLSEGDNRIQLRRGARVITTTQAAQSVAPVFAPVAAMPIPPTPAPAATTKAEPTPPPAKKLHEIKSPTVGTFYAQKDPGSPAFVTVGTRVTPTTVVCIIEAMKVFNEITADCTGVIAEICLANKSPVEFNSVLFRVDPLA